MITGSTRADGTVRVAASRRLSFSELTAEFAHQLAVLDMPPAFLTTDVRLTCIMHHADLVIVEAPDYAAAMAAVQEHWKGQQQGEGPLGLPQGAGEGE